MASRGESVHGVRTAARALLVSSSALLCLAWSFPPETEAADAVAEAEFGVAPILEAAEAPIGIAPEDVDQKTIELDPSPVLPVVLPSVAEDPPEVLEDAAL